LQDLKRSKKTTAQHYNKFSWILVASGVAFPVALDSPLFLLGALCVGLLFTFFCRLLSSMATGHNLIFPPRTMRLLSVILLIQSGLQSAIGVTIQGILTCNLYANQTSSIDVLLHSPNYKGASSTVADRWKR
jgi:hypothetical protein